MSDALIHCLDIKSPSFLGIFPYWNNEIVRQINNSPEPIETIQRLKKSMILRSMRDCMTSQKRALDDKAILQSSIQKQQKRPSRVPQTNTTSPFRLQKQQNHRSRVPTINQILKQFGQIRQQLWSGLRAACSEWNVCRDADDTPYRMLRRLDDEVAKGDDEDGMKTWNQLSAEFQDAYDKLIGLGVIRHDQYRVRNDGKNTLIEIDGTDQLRSLATLDPIAQRQKVHAPIITLNASLQITLDHPELLPILKVLVILYAITDGQMPRAQGDHREMMMADSVWKKLTPFIFDGGRNIEQNTDQDNRQALRQYQSFQNILFANDLKAEYVNFQFWTKELSSPQVGYVADIHLILQQSADGSYTLDTITFRNTSPTEFKKSHWIFSLYWGVGKNAHENGLIYTNGTFYYIEPNGAVSGNLYVQNRDFKRIWQNLMKAFNGVFRPNTTVRFDVDRLPVFLLNLLDKDGGFRAFRRFQPVVQGRNLTHRGETGGYCFSITLFILQLFRQNCYEGQDAWTSERLQLMLDTYLVISTATDEIQYEIRGFNVSAMRTLKALRRIKIAVSSVQKDPTSRRRRLMPRKRSIQQLIEKFYLLGIHDQEIPKDLISQIIQYIGDTDKEIQIKRKQLDQSFKRFMEMDLIEYISDLCKTMSQNISDIIHLKHFRNEFDYARRVLPVFKKVFSTILPEPLLREIDRVGEHQFPKWHDVFYRLENNLLKNELQRRLDAAIESFWNGDVRRNDDVLIKNLELLQNHPDPEIQRTKTLLLNPHTIIGSSEAEIEAWLRRIFATQKRFLQDRPKHRVERILNAAWKNMFQEHIKAVMGKKGRDTDTVGQMLDNWKRQLLQSRA